MVLFKLVALLQNWTVMVSKKVKERVAELIRHMVTALIKFRGVLFALLWLSFG